MSTAILQIFVTICSASNNLAMRAHCVNQMVQCYQAEKSVYKTDMQAEKSVYKTDMDPVKTCLKKLEDDSK